MKRLVIFFVLFMIMCGFSIAFGQLKVGNNFGQNLKITINGEKNDVPDKAIKTFSIRGQKSVYLECTMTNGKTFFISKEVSRSGAVTVEPGDNSAVISQSSQSVVVTTTNIPVTNSSGASPLDAILKGGGQQPVAQTSSTQTTYVSTQQTTMPAQNQISLELIKVVYTGAERFKVFSDMGNGQWQGLEFRGKAKADSIQDNAKNEYTLLVQKDRDIHIGVVFNPEDAINIYGELRKRVNRNDAVLYINEGDIKKMSTNEKKAIKIKFLAKDYKLFFDPKDEDNKVISISYNETSRKFLAPIGQFYLKTSCTNTATGMFYPTVYIPVHVASGDGVVIINTEQVKRATSGADLNLKWSNLQ